MIVAQNDLIMHSLTDGVPSVSEIQRDICQNCKKNSYPSALYVAVGTKFGVFAPHFG